MLSAYKTTAYVLLGGALCKAWQLIFSCFSLCALVKRCFLDCQFTGARSNHITDAKRVSSSGSTETWELAVTFASDGFTGYTASVSVDTAKSAVTQIVIRTANYTLTVTPA